MKLFRKVAALIACAGFALSLAACQSGEKPTTEPSDVELMGEATGMTDQISTEPFYVLVVGNDSRTGTIEIGKAEYADGLGRSDTTMLLRIDPTTYQVAILTVPRDTAISYEGTTAKFNEAYQWGGIEATLEQVELLTGVKPKYYLDMGFVEFEKFVDELGGVTANVPIDMGLQDIVSGDQVSLSEGMQDLSGAEALVLSRSRKQYAEDQDACRQIQDRQLMETAINKVAADPANAAVHAQSLIDNVTTNWPADSLIKMVTDFAKNADKIQIASGSGPYVGDIDESMGLWFTTRDEATWARIIETIEAGGDPTSVVALPEIIPAG